MKAMVKGQQPIILNGKFLSAPPTGVHRVAEELANALADLRDENHPAVAGISLEVWVPKDATDQAHRIRWPSRTVKPLVHIPWEQLTLPVRAGNRTILSLCNIGPAAQSNAITMIHDAQVHLSPQSYSLPFRLWYRFIQPLFAKRHRLLLTVSDYSRGELTKAGLGTIERIATVHNGVDHVLRQPADGSVLDRLRLRDVHYVLALATTQAHKNIGVLLKAFADPSLADLRLVLFGSADASDFVAAGHAVPAGVRFAGRVSDGEMRALLESARCLAFPSLTEGFGLPPLEAMILGCPAVVAPCGALPEVCGKAALYADPSEPQDWVRQILSICRDQVFRSQLQRESRLHANKYSWRQAGLKLAEILNKR
jgi:glycosyltransferase involved in cell wall biosynthesis